jgi:hypothetical protein
MAGFASLKFMDADVVYDGGFQGTTAGNVSVLGSGGSWLSGSGAPASHMYFLNTDFIHLRPHKDRDMVPLDPGSVLRQPGRHGEAGCVGRQYDLLQPVPPGRHHGLMGKEIRT